MKRIFETFIVLALVATCSSFAFAGKHERREAAKETREHQEELVGLEKKASQHLTKEGVSGTLVWKEYCANPNAQGIPSLVVVLGGKDSASGGRKAPEPAKIFLENRAKPVAGKNDGEGGESLHSRYEFTCDGRFFRLHHSDCSSGCGGVAASGRRFGFDRAHSDWRMTPSRIFISASVMAPREKIRSKPSIM